MHPPISQDVKGRTIAGALAALGAAVLVFTPVLMGNQLGNFPDSPWTISLFEHWYRFFMSREDIRQTIFFHPDPNALGYSDAFVTQGLIYTPLRLLGLDPIASWAATNFVMLCLMNLGFAALVSQLLWRRTMIVIVVLIGTLNYAFLTQLSHLQTLGFGLTFWLWALVVAIVLHPNRAAKWFVPLLIPLFLLQALTAWYAIVFTLVIGCLMAVGMIIFAPQLLKSIGTSLGAASRVLVRHHPLVAALSGALSLSLAVLWTYIYFPSFSTAGKPWSEYVTYAPTLSDIVNVSQGDGPWQVLFRRLSLFDETLSMERATGITPIMLASFLIAAAICLGLVSRGHLALRIRFYLVIVFTVVSALALFIVDARGEGLYHLLWSYVPGAGSIRSALRVNILLVPLMGLGLGILCERFLDSTSANRSSARTASVVVVGALLALIAAEQFRGINATWTRGDFIPERFANVPAQLQASDCRSFVISEQPQPGEQWWEMPVSAVNIAVLSGVPTLNGYSGNPPEGYPNFYRQTPDSVEAIVAWSEANGGEEPCVVTSVDGNVRVKKPASTGSTSQ